VTRRAVECQGRRRSRTITPTATFRTRGRDPTAIVVTSTRTVWMTVTSVVVVLSRPSVSTAATSLSTMSPAHAPRCLGFHRLSDVKIHKSCSFPSIFLFFFSLTGFYIECSLRCLCVGGSSPCLSHAPFVIIQGGSKDR